MGIVVILALVIAGAFWLMSPEEEKASQLQKTKAQTDKALRDIRRLREGHNINEGWWGSWFGKRRGVQHVADLQNKNHEAGELSALLDKETRYLELLQRQEMMPAKLEREEELEVELHQASIVQTKAAKAEARLNKTLLKKARKNGMTLAMMFELEHKERMDELELRRMWVETEQKLKGSFIYAQRDHQYVQMLQEYLFGLYDERRRLEESNDPTNAYKLKILNTRITQKEKLIRKQERLLTQGAQKSLPRYSSEA